MIVILSAVNHVAYAKRWKINPMPYVGKCDSRANVEKHESNAKCRKTWPSAGKQESHAKHGKQMRCQTWENTNLMRSAEKKSDAKRGKQDSF